MNRLRKAYLELHPELEPHFVTSPYDDLPGVLHSLGLDIEIFPDKPLGRSPQLGSAFHGFQTLPGMLSVIVAAYAGAIGALVAFAIVLPLYGVLIVGAALF